MAITLRDLTHMAAAGLGLGLLTLQAHAQQTPAAAPAAAAPVIGSAVTPTLSAQVLHSDNATLRTGDNRQSDTVVTVTPGLSVQYRSANSRVTGQMQVSSVSHLGNTRPDRLLPRGRLAFNTDVARQGVGLDASVAADQVSSQFTSAASASPNTADTYTNTRIQISPYFERALDAQTLVRARLERTQLQSTGNSSTLTRRPDTATSLATAGGSNRSDRVTYALDTRYLDTETDGPLTTVSTQRSIRGTVLYALSTELDAGVILGRESSQFAAQRVRDTIKGLRLDWRPSERTTLGATIEDRFFGSSWTADFAHRSNNHSLGLNSSRQISNYISTTGVGSAAGGATQALLDAMLTTRIPNEAERAKAVNDLIVQRNLPQQLAAGRDLYDLNTLVRQNLVLRGAIMNARTMLLVSAGQAHSRPLAGAAFSSVLGAGRETRERYIDAPDQPPADAHFHRDRRAAFRARPCHQQRTGHLRCVARHGLPPQREHGRVAAHPGRCRRAPRPHCRRRARGPCRWHDHGERCVRRA